MSGGAVSFNSRLWCSRKSVNFGVSHLDLNPASITYYFVWEGENTISFPEIIYLDFLHTLFD